MTAYMTHAKTAFGPINTWGDAVIASVGNLIGGLSDTELATLTSSQIAAITPEAVSQMPAASFVGFTPDQLAGFSLAQALSVTNTQIAGLSAEQKNALASAGANIQSGGTGLQVSLTLMSALALATLKLIV